MTDPYSVCIIRLAADYQCRWLGPPWSSLWFSWLLTAMKPFALFHQRVIFYYICFTVMFHMWGRGPLWGPNIRLFIIKNRIKGEETHYKNTPILKILQPLKENIQIKNSEIFHISAQNIDCGYPLEPPRRGGSNECPQLCFCFSKIIYIPVNPSFTI